MYKWDINIDITATLKYDWNHRNQTLQIDAETLVDGTLESMKQRNRRRMNVW